MKFQFIKIALLLVFNASCQTVKLPPEEVSPIQLRQEALDFSLSIIKGIFEKDCEEVYSKFNAEVISFGDDETYQIAEYKDDLCEVILEDAIYNEEKTYSDYLKEYQREVLTPAEIVARYEDNLPDYYQPTEKDFFFLGHEIKAEGIGNYVSEDLFVFLIRKENGKWSIIGLVG